MAANLLKLQERQDELQPIDAVVTLSDRTKVCFQVGLWSFNNI